MTGRPPRQGAAMPHDPLSVVQNVYAAFGRGDIPALLDALAPDVRWEVVGRKGDYPTFGVRHGRSQT